MPLFIWKPSYSVNNPELDRHHQSLFNLLNRLYQSCFDENDQLSPAAVHLELAAYTDYHFTAEEQYMVQTGYTGLERHRSAHALFTERVKRLGETIETRDDAVLQELIVYLGNWLLNHVLEDDRDYALQAALPA